jgi:hypothetical protein
MLYDEPLVMTDTQNPILCDGCARPASPSHIAERLARLERATRFRPVHITVLFVALAPEPPAENDFYGPPQSSNFFESLLAALDISPAAGDRSAKLSEFQRRGFYLSYLAECPIPGDSASEAAAIRALAPALLRRIRFNYRPKHIALLGPATSPLIEILNQSGLGPLLILDRGNPQAFPVPSGLPAGSGLRSALRAALSTSATS